LIQAAKKEKYYDQSQAVMEELKTKLSHNLEKDMQLFRTEITAMLSDEIISRYYFQKGRIEYMLRDDKGLDSARTVLASTEGYRKKLNR
jgi:carboxyl-terminal processing protease